MAWENRKGRSYYYRRRRKHGRCTREYVPKALADLAAGLDVARRQKRALDREQRQAEQARWQRGEAALDELGALAAGLFRAVMAKAGYHQHQRGDWRKRR